MGAKKSLITFILLSVVYKIYFICYAYPYLFHPDESYLLKDPLKILLLYKSGDFSSSTNLYFWISGFYTGLIFIFGKLFHLWSSLQEFTNQVILDNPSIYIAGRSLSVILATLGNCLYIKFISRFVKDRYLLGLFAVLLLFNPIEIYSNNWIKFDPFCYLYFALVINVGYLYFTAFSSPFKKYFYPILFSGLAVRIDFAAFLLAAFLFDCYNQGILSVLKSNFKFILGGILLYCVITLYPLSLIYNLANHHTIETEKIKIVKPFESVILERLRNDPPNVILRSALRNAKFYFVDCLLMGLGPFIMWFFFTRTGYKFREVGYLHLFILFLMGFLLISSASMPHYSLLISVSVLMLSILSINKIKKQRIKYLVAILSACYVLSMAVENIVITRKPDPRIAAKEYLNSAISHSEPIAIDKFSLPGLHPPLSECKDVLLKKALLINKYGEGTGETFRLKAGLPDTSCRNILEIFDYDPYFRDSVYKGYFINAYDIRTFAKKNIRIFVTPFDLNEHKDGRHKDFYSYIVQNYSLIKAFETPVNDLRLKSLYPFLTSIFIYEKKDQ